HARTSLSLRTLVVAGQGRNGGTSRPLASHRGYHRGQRRNPPRQLTSAPVSHGVTGHPDSDGRRTRSDYAPILITAPAYRATRRAEGVPRGSSTTNAVVWGRRWFSQPVALPG